VHLTIEPLPVRVDSPRAARHGKETTMHEDTAGTQSAGTRTTYSTCAECGQVFRQHDSRPIAAGLNDGSHSEFTEICPSCEALDLQGERVLISGEDDF
jgi:hypothetical protein